MKLTALIPWLIEIFYVFFQFLMQTAVGIMDPQWMQDFHVDKLGLGNLSAVFYTYIVMQISAGILFDRYPTRNVLMLAALILSVGCFYIGAYRRLLYCNGGKIIDGVGIYFWFRGNTPNECHSLLCQ